MVALLGLKGIEVNAKMTGHNTTTNRNWSWCGINLVHLNGRYINGLTPILLAAILKYKKSFELLVKDERVDLKATASVNGKMGGNGGMSEIFELQGFNENTQKMTTL